MPNYRRVRAPGATYFFTVVTARRRPLLTTRAAVDALRESLAQVRLVMPFTVDAWVVLPDHMHAIWTLPEGDSDFSKRWGRLKAGFTRRCAIAHCAMPRREAGIWQSRFWEHRIRDRHDFGGHMDYLHYNPVKHGWVDRVADWPYSSFHRCVRQGIYDIGWGTREPIAPRDDVGE